MTHSGGKPHNVGDQGQRYEVSYFDLDTRQRKVFGWSNNLIGARVMCRSIRMHPAWEAPEIKDRKT